MQYIKLISGFQFKNVLLSYVNGGFVEIARTSPNTYAGDGDSSCEVGVADNFKGALVWCSTGIGATLIGFTPEELARTAPAGVLVNAARGNGEQYELPASMEELLKAQACGNAGYTGFVKMVPDVTADVTPLPLKEGGAAYAIPYYAMYYAGAAFLIQQPNGELEMWNGFEDSAPEYRDGVIQSRRDWHGDDQRRLEPVVRFLSKGGKASQLFNTAKRRWDEELVHSAFALTHPRLAEAWCK